MAVGHLEAELALTGSWVFDVPVGLRGSEGCLEAPLQAKMRSKEGFTLTHQTHRGAWTADSEA